MNALVDLLSRVLGDVVDTLVADWPYLLASIVVAAALTVYVGTERLARWLRRRRWVAISGAVLLATLTPFCSCGTTAVVLGMIATEAPWAPIVTFMVASPLTSPSELLLSAGLFGWTFALVYFIGATGLGFLAGGVTGLLEDRGWLAGQARMRTPPAPCAPSCGSAEAAAGGSTDGAAAGGSTDGAAAGGGGTLLVLERARPTAAQRLAIWLRMRELAAASLRLGWRIAAYFLAFSVVGYLIIEALPTVGLIRLLGDNPLWGVPFAALLGIPIYVSSEAGLPMVAALVRGGLGAGPAMAFLLSGAGTSVGAITGALLIARRRVVGLVVALLLLGAMVLGWIAAAALG